MVVADRFHCTGIFLTSLTHNVIICLSISRYSSDNDTAIHCINFQVILVQTWWRHQMEAFSVLVALCEGNPPITGGFPSQRPVTRSFDLFFHLHLNKRLNKQRIAGDLRRQGANYDVTVIIYCTLYRKMVWCLNSFYLIIIQKPCSAWRVAYHSVLNETR